MKTISVFGAAAITALLATSSAFAATDQNILIDQSERTVDHMRSDPAFGPARDMLNKARAVLVIPGLVKGGFIFGAEGGSGVLMERRGDRWSEPAFYTMGSASFGLQIGLEKAEIVMMIMSDRGLRAIEDGDVKLGAGGGLTVATLSAGAEAATAGNLSGDIVVWTSATGAYGGLTFNGSVIQPRREWNETFYGKPASVPDILSDRVHNPDTGKLRAKLSEVTKVAAR